MTARPIVVLHGFTGSGAAMAPLTEPLRSTTGVTVTAPDLAGHGTGPHSTDGADYTIDSMAAAVAARFEPDAPVHLVGYSMGGRVALTLACAQPAQVASLSLIGASAGIADADERAARRRADDDLAAALEADFDEFIDRWMANPLFATQARLGPDVLAAARAQRRSNDPAALARSLRFAGTGQMTPLHQGLPDLAMPVGLIVGADDPKFRGIAAELAAAMPNAAVHVIANAGHASHLEQPMATVGAITATMELS